MNYGFCLIPILFIENVQKVLKKNTPKIKRKKENELRFLTPLHKYFVKALSAKYCSADSLCDCRKQAFNMASRLLLF